MAKISGFSFKKSKTGDFVSVPGKKQLPHRIDLIKKALADNKNPLDLFFNFELDDCITASGASEIKEEIKLFEAWENGLSGDGLEFSQ